MGAFLARILSFFGWRTAPSIEPFRGSRESERTSQEVRELYRASSAAIRGIDRSSSASITNYKKVSRYGKQSERSIRPSAASIRFSYVTFTRPSTEGSISGKVSSSSGTTKVSNVGKLSVSSAQRASTLSNKSYTSARSSGTSRLSYVMFNQEKREASKFLNARDSIPVRRRTIHRGGGFSGFGKNVSNAERLKGSSGGPSNDTGKCIITLQFTGKAGSVFITGNWLDWKDRIELKRTPTNVELWVADVIVPMYYERDLEMKYIVDGDWVTSADMPTKVNEEGILNNVIILVEET